MAQATNRGRQRRRLSLSVRLSLLVLAAALLPLALVVGYTNYQAQNKLKQQGQASLATAASVNATAVAASMQERSKDGDALATLTTTQALLACPHLSDLTQQIPASLAPYVPVLTAVMKCGDPLYNQLSSVRALKVGIVRDINYTIWSLYDPAAHELLSCRPDAASDAQCGTGLSGSNVSVPSEDQAGLKSGQQFISDVHYDAKAGSAYVQVYTPIKLSFVSIAGVLSDLLQAAQGQPAAAVLPGLSTYQLTQLMQAVQSGQLIAALKALPTPTVGYLRSTLKLDYVWSIVNKEQGANGSGSYAFITDQNGVRVADANGAERWTSVHPLSSATQQLITSEQRYGNGNAVSVDDLPSVWSALQSTAAGPHTFQSIVAPNSKLSYQYVGVHLTDVAPPGKTLPLAWTYFVLSPLSTVTQVADDQVTTTLEAAAAVAVLAVLLGLLLGRGMASPVQRSVADLQGASESLTALASKQHNSASEQQWVVDACKTGLDSVRYLSDAMHQASLRIVDAANWFGEYWDRLTEEQAQRTVQHLRELSHYIEEASRRQWTSSDRLDKAITVTTQVSDQLAAGASAAADSAAQLDDVVHQLQRLVGGKVRTYESGSYEAESGYEEPDLMSAQPMDSRLPIGAGQRALPPGPMGNAGPRAPLMPGGWQSGANQRGAMSSGYPGGGMNSGYPGGGPISADYSQGGFGPQRGPVSPNVGAGFGQGGFSPQRGPASPNVAAGFGPEFGQEQGQDHRQGAPAGWPGGGAANGRGVRVWEDQ